jgi:hypothetical protein
MKPFIFTSGIVVFHRITVQEMKKIENLRNLVRK